MKELKCKCGSNQFNVETNDTCSGCQYNGAYCDDNDEYIYDQDKIDTLKLERSEVNDSRSCDMGLAFGGGCNIIICDKCGSTCNHIPMMDE